MALMQITIIPLGTETPSVGSYVADVQELLADKKGIDFELNDMGTLIHGNAKELLHLAAEIHEHSFNKGAKRVVTQISIDDRRDIERSIGEKKQAVKDLLAERGK
ncbi:MAG: MTH1187 family thiamine-binding protein [Desulfobulbaceae bacterium]|nr:MTH1187 family thiamine-binding protein [Desulfobulbaceae bacterium]